MKELFENLKRAIDKDDLDKIIHYSLRISELAKERYKLNEE